MRTARRFPFLPHTTPLDPCSLGRPVHLLPAFGKLLRADLSELLEVRLNRRYGASFAVGEVTLNPMRAEQSTQRCMIFETEAGSIGCSMDRQIVLTALSYRYGERAALTSQAMETPPARTTTEERLERLLSSQIITTVSARAKGERAVLDAAVTHPLAAVKAGLFPVSTGAWTVCVPIREAVADVRGSLHLLLDDAWMAQLWRNIAPARPSDRRKGEPMVPVKQLPLELTARLMEKEVTVGQVMDLRIGDIIPMSLGSADVFVEDARLFTGAIAEHGGKLCLTNLNDTE